MPPFRFPAPVGDAIEEVAALAREHADSAINHQLLATAVLEQVPNKHLLLHFLLFR